MVATVKIIAQRPLIASHNLVFFDNSEVLRCDYLIGSRIREPLFSGQFVAFF